MKALVLSGGGRNGAYEVGAVRYLLGERGMDFDILTGTSAGALNTGFLAQYKSGEEKEAASKLEEIWRSIKGNKSIYENWPFFGKTAALWKHSVFCTAPLRKLVRDNFDLLKVMSSGKKLGIAAVDLKSGALMFWNEMDDDLEQGILASSAFPVLFEPVAIGRSLFVDGGVREVTPLKRAIELGADDITVVVTGPKDPPEDNRAKWTALDVAKRSLQLLMDEVMDGDLVRARKVNTFVDMALTHGTMKSPFGYRPVQVKVIRPKEDLGDSMDFSPKEIARLIDLGYADAVRAFADT